MTNNVFRLAVDRLARAVAVAALALTALASSSAPTPSAASEPPSGRVQQSTATLVRGGSGSIPVDGGDASAESRSAAEAHTQTLALPPVRSAQGVSSIAFVQVYSPFVWGRASVNGLSVTITLEDAAGTVKAVATQTTQAAPNNYVKIDRTQLYYETVFVAPNDPAHPPVMISPGDRVHVVTNGLDPATGQSATDDRRVVVDDLRAWTLTEQDRIAGSAPAGAPVTVTSGALYLSGYLTPGSGLTYTDTTAGGDGSFAVDKLRTSADPTLKKVDLQQGATGFVRVKHADGSEVYTVHGQSTFVLENSSVLHAWAFALPSAPYGLEGGVTVTRPPPKLTATLKGSSGVVKDSTSAVVSAVPFNLAFANASIQGGDIVEVAINNGPPNQVAAGRITATMQLATSTVTGSGPANTQLLLGAAKIQGYLMANTYFDYVQQRVITDGSGSFSSTQFNCLTNSYVTFRPGSFGYVGYEDPHGNFVYISYAVPTNQVMSDYPFIEGWVADGNVRPNVTILGGDGATKQQATVGPSLVWLAGQKLFMNSYYQLTTSQFILPGDKVLVTSGAWSSTIPVDRITAWLDSDTGSVVGDAPAGAKIRVIPSIDRTSRADVTAGGDGAYRASNPFTSVSGWSCMDGPRTVASRPGDSGRAYLSLGDNNEVFTAYGRAMHVNQNENYVELYLSPTRDLDWDTIPQRTATVTLTPRRGPPITMQVKADFGRPGLTRVNLVDALGQRVLIRAGDAIAATFDEGPTALTRPVTMEMKPQALVTGSPDVDASTLAGVGPRGWGGFVTLNSQPTVPGQMLSPTGTTAYNAVSFTDNGTKVPLVRGYSGTVSFTNRTGQRLWTAWAVAAVPVKIGGFPSEKDTQVCGTGPAGAALRVHDVSTDGQDVILGTGSVDGAGNWCVSVTALVKGQVILAEADGVFSQPSVIGGGNRIFIAYTSR